MDRCRVFLAKAGRKKKRGWDSSISSTAHNKGKGKAKQATILKKEFKTNFGHRILLHSKGAAVSFVAYDHRIFENRHIV